ncbi:MAG: HAMP domain-containing protein, partial [Psychromonas sp.]|nr:HAMP domain-containing protein [Psychromonas sp.]
GTVALKLTIKLFASFAITTVISVVLLVGLTQWSLQQGFNHFIEQLEGEELTEIENELKNLFIKHGSWQVLNQQPELWRQLGRSSAPANKGPNNKDYNRPPPRNDDYGRPQNRDVRERRPREQNRPSAPPPRNRDAIGRISLYDSGKNVVKGRTEITENPIIHTLQHNGEVIGYLALVPEKSVEQGPDTNFLAEQAMMGLIIGGVVLLFALLVAYLLSRHLLAPIHTLTYGTTRLKAGDYEHEIKSQAANKDELTQLCDDFNELGDTLKHNQQQRQQWASNISHELRTPLTILQTQIEAIIDGIFAPDKKRLLLLQSETARLRRLIDDLYHLSLADSNTLIYQKQSVELLPILQQAVEHYEVKCNNKQIKLQLQPQIISPAYLLADADRLLQLFTNLL